MRDFWARLTHLTLAEWVQVVSALGAVAAAIAGFIAAVVGARAARAARDSAITAERQLPELKKQVEIGIAQAAAAEQQVELARQATAAAIAAVQEASRARTDERAPRVTALMEAPEWPPLIDVSRRGMPYANELRLLHPQSLDQSKPASSTEPFVFDGQRDWFMWFRVRGVLINEGASAARVRLDGEAQFVEGATKLVDVSHIQVPPIVGSPDRKEYLLRPGEAALFEWAYGHTLGEWADAYENPNPPNPRGACFFTVTVFDSFEHGVIDHIFVLMGGRPIEPVPGALGQWAISAEGENGAMGITVYPTRRTYLSEGWREDPLPWEEMFADWRNKNELQG